MPFIGRNIEVGLGRETIRGTAVAPTFWIPKMEAGIEERAESVIDEATRGVIEDSVGAEVVKRWSEGDITGIVRDRSFGLLLLATLGKVTTSTLAGTARQHLFEILQSAAHQSLTIGMRNPAQQLRFALAVPTSLEIRCELAKFVEFTAGFLSRLGVTAADTVSYTTENQFLAHHITFRLADSLAGLDAAMPIRVRNITLNIAKNVEADDVLGSIEPFGYINKQVEVSGSVELLYSDTTLKSFFLAGTTRAMRIDIVNPSVVIETGVNPQLRIDLARVQFPEWTREGALNDIVRQTLNFKGHYSLADTQAIRIRLTNNQATY